MAEDRLFVGSAVLDGWVRSGLVELTRDAIFVRGLDRTYRIEEAVHILAEVSGSGDPDGLVGSVKPVADIAAGSGELFDRSLVVSDRAFDVVPGFLVSPEGDGKSEEGKGEEANAETASHLVDLAKWCVAPPPNRSDEELLARYLMEKLE